MTSTKELKLAYGIAAALLIVGVLSYTAFSAKSPEEPLRMVFRGVAGSVLFDHKTHAADYGLNCGSCHHHPSDPGEGAAMTACSTCHVFEKDGPLPASCLECHGEGEVSTEGVPGQTDALHGQCIGCHKDGGSGPVECAACHRM
ncbi:MAG: cytochrome c3 family protein [Desulfococcaceae bacterium]